MFIKRNLEPDILEGALYFPVVAILGPRQSGKTTLAKTLFKNHTYISLEDMDARAAARMDPRTFLLANPSADGIIIDEFQLVPDLLSYIQTMVDQEKKPGFFILTGSQNFLMNKAISQSLAGRISLHTLLPLSISELKQNNLLPAEIEEFMYKGCYPAIYAEGIPADRLYKNYIKTYLERDVRELTNVGDLSLFQTFIGLCAARIGQLVNFTKLAEECGVSQPTARRWFDILETSYIVFRLSPYHKNFGKRLKKTEKIFFYDSGLACSILRIKEEELALHPSRGGLFETCIISDILKWRYNHGQEPNDVYFWQDSAGREIDCMIADGLHTIPIEIKASRTISGRFFENLTYWEKIEGKKEKSFVVYAASENQVRTNPKLISWQSIDTIFSSQSSE